MHSSKRVTFNTIHRQIKNKQKDGCSNQLDKYQRFLLVTAFDTLIANRFVRLAVDPTDTQQSTTVKVFDEAHKPSSLNATFNGESPASLHLPSCARAALRSNFAITSDDNDLFQIDKTSEVRKIRKRVRRFEDWEIEVEVGVRKNINSLKELSFNSVDDLEVCRVVMSDSLAEFSFLV